MRFEDVQSSKTAVRVQNKKKNNPNISNRSNRSNRSVSTRDQKILETETFHWSDVSVTDTDFHMFPLRAVQRQPQGVFRDSADWGCVQGLCWLRGVFWGYETLMSSQLRLKRLLGNTLRDLDEVYRTANTSNCLQIRTSAALYCSFKCSVVGSDRTCSGFRSDLGV